MLKRIFDIIFSLIALVIFFPIFLIIAIAIRLESRGPVIHWSNRIGKNNINFKMPKFRTMKKNTPQIATHLLKDSQLHITKCGHFLRKTSLDELPQLWSILIGDMSIVGPRPALYNQYDLKELRTKLNIHTLLPGLTGLAQISGRDELPINEKVKFDEIYLKNISLTFDLKIIWKTIRTVIKRSGINH